MTRPSRRTAAVLALAGLVIAVGVLVHAVTGGHSPGIVPGYMEASTSAVTDPVGTVSIELPQGTVTVAVAKPTGSMSAYELGPREDDSGDVSAGRNARIVALSWGFQRRSLPAPLAFYPVEQFGLALVADGRRYDLRADGTTGARLLVVSGDAKDLQVEVSFEGLAQTADVATGTVADPGAAAPYYSTDGTSALRPEGDCQLLDAAQRRRFEDETSGGSGCWVGAVYAEPWVPGLGWAPAGTQWWLVPAHAVHSNELDTRGVFDERRVGFDGPLRVTLDGQAPVRAILPTVGGYSPGVDATYVFSSATPPRTVHLTARFRATPWLRAGTGVVRFGVDRDFALR